VIEGRAIRRARGAVNRATIRVVVAVGGIRRHAEHVRTPGTVLAEALVARPVPELADRVLQDGCQLAPPTK
jgi:hypothetical protein